MIQIQCEEVYPKLAEKLVAKADIKSKNKGKL